MHTIAVLSTVEMSCLVKVDFTKFTTSPVTIGKVDYNQQLGLPNFEKIDTSNYKPWELSNHIQVGMDLLSLANQELSFIFILNSYR